MGLMRFVVPGRERLTASVLERAYISGLDELPYITRTQLTDEGLSARRVEDDSGNFHIPWRVAGYGERLLATATLMERPAPYHLTVELARGTINRVRNQIAGWQSLGLTLSGAVTERLGVALEHLSVATTRQHEPLVADEAATRALEVAHQASAQLSREYAEQALANRRRQAQRTVPLLGVNLGCSLLKEQVQKEIVATFNAALIPLVWKEVEQRESERDWSLCDRQIEWARTRGLKICGGPLLQLDRRALPDWIYLWEGDEERLLALAAEHIRSTVMRYRGKVNLWLCGSRFNAGEVLSLDEEQRLRLAALSAEATRQVDPRTPVVLAIDQPWAEFMGRRECDLSPLHFADTLVRAELGLAGIALEINLGYWPDGTQSRDPLDFSRQLDRWSSLGLPLLLMITLPSDNSADRQARGEALPLDCADGGLAAGDLQRLWIEQFLPLVMAKQPVQGIFWNQLLDSAPHDFPHGGLFDAADRPKPALAALRALREQYLS